MEKRGLVTELKVKGVTSEVAVYWADEMRLGLISQVRRVWSSIGKKIVQKIQISYKYIYLHLAVDGLTGKIHWQWENDMQSETVKRVVQQWKQDGVGAIVWDGAPSHRANEMKTLGIPLICQPPYSPELNPAERIFESIRQVVEGVVYKTLALKMQVVDSYLQALNKTPEKIQSLAGWAWINESIAQI